ncbi:unnamed protein product [Camellia sinensis]
MVNQTQDKNLKEGLTVDTTGAQGVKYKKTKTHKSQAFQALRTDERGILKEANLERKMQALVPHKEIIAAFTLLSRSLHKKHGNEIQRNEKCLEQRKCNHDTNESSGNELQKNYQKDEPKQKMDVTSKKSENSLRKTKSSSQHKQFISPKGVASTKKAMACGKQLTVVKDISSTTLRSEEEGEPSHGDISHVNKAATSSASRSLSRGKRPLIIPKKPNFHNIHVPKCYARKVA